MPKKGNVIKASDLMFRDGSQSFSSNATFDAKLFIRDGSANQGTPTVTLALGDMGTGFKWNGGGDISLYANNQEVINFTGTTITAKKPLSMNNNSITGVTSITATDLTLSGLLNFGSGQSLTSGERGTPPTQGIKFSASTDEFYLFMRENTSDGTSGLILQLGDEIDDFLQIEQVSPEGEATPAKLFNISEYKGATFYTVINAKDMVTIDCTSTPKGLQFDLGANGMVGIYGDTSTKQVGLYDYTNVRTIWYYDITGNKFVFFFFFYFAQNTAINSVL